MPILNYTTQVMSEKTVMEIQQILARAGAKTISVDYDELGQPSAVTFVVQILGRWVNYRLPSNFKGVQTVLQLDPAVPNKFKTAAQAQRVAWRIIKEWCAAQMALIEANQAELAEIFLPYAVMDSGRTLFQEFRSGTLLLGKGTQDE